MACGYHLLEHHLDDVWEVNVIGVLFKHRVNLLVFKAHVEKLSNLIRPQRLSHDLQHPVSVNITILEGFVFIIIVHHNCEEVGLFRNAVHAGPFID